MLDEAAPANWLVVGSHELKTSVHRPAEWQVSLLECPNSMLAPDVDGSRLYELSLDDWPEVRALRLNQDGNIVDRGTASLSSVLEVDTNIPLGLFRAESGSSVRVYPHVDSYLNLVRFIMLPGAASERDKAVFDLLAGIDEHFLKVSNHLCFRVKLLPDVELEHKFTLTGAPDVYTLARQTLRMTDRGELPGWIAGFRERIEGWDFLNHVYAIDEPREEAGYVSFIPTTDGRHTVKRKIFTEDMDERPELRSRGAEVGASYESYIRDVLKLVPSWHASFRRVRYDILVESIQSGDVFVIAHDRSTIIDSEGAAVPGFAELTQCEIEYVYSQSLGPASFELVREELGELREFMSAYFDQQGIENYQRHESKLTFMREQYAAVG